MSYSKWGYRPLGHNLTSNIENIYPLYAITNNQYKCGMLMNVSI